MTAPACNRWFFWCCGVGFVCFLVGFLPYLLLDSLLN